MMKTFETTLIAKSKFCSTSTMLMPRSSQSRVMISPIDLANAIALRDIAMVSRAPGVGKKVAERIVTELKAKAPAFAGEASGTIGLKQELGEGVAAAPVADAVSALTNLGYSRDIAANAVAAAMKVAGDGADSAKLIDQHAAGGRVLQAGDDAQQGRLAAARRADEDDEFAILDVEVDAFQHIDGAEGFLDILDLQRAHGCSSLDC